MKEEAEKKEKEHERIIKERKKEYERIVKEREAQEANLKTDYE